MTAPDLQKLSLAKIKLTPTQLEIAGWLDGCPCFCEVGEDAKELADERDCTVEEAQSYIHAVGFFGEFDGVLHVPLQGEVIEYALAELKRFEDSFLDDEERDVRGEYLYLEKVKAYRALPPLPKDRQRLMKAAVREAREQFRIDRRAVRGLYAKVEKLEGGDS